MRIIRKLRDYRSLINFKPFAILEFVTLEDENGYFGGGINLPGIVGDPQDCSIHQTANMKHARSSDETSINTVYNTFFPVRERGPRCGHRWTLLRLPSITTMTRPQADREKKHRIESGRTQLVQLGRNNWSKLKFFGYI